MQYNASFFQIFWCARYAGGGEVAMILIGAMGLCLGRVSGEIKSVCDQLFDIMINKLDIL